MKKIVALALAAIMVASMTACAQPAAEETAAVTTETTTTNDRSDELYIEVSALSGDPYFYDHSYGCEIAGEELGVRTEYVGPADLDMNDMNTAFEQAIAKQPDGIVVVGFDAQLEPTINKAIAAGIPVVTIDADLPDSDRIAFVGTGNETAGEVGGEKLAELMGYEGKCILLYNPGQSNLEDRSTGYQTILAKYPDIEIVGIVDTQQDSIVAAQNVAQILQIHPDLKGIACIDGTAGPGAATAIQEAGLEGEVAIVAFDRSNEILEAIESGVISASVAQQTALMPYYGIQLLMNLNASNVEISTNNAEAGVLGVPEYIDTGAVIIDADNYQYFMR